MNTKTLNNISPEVAKLDFKGLKWKLSESSEAEMSPETCDLAEREYRRFLTLKARYPHAILVPSKLMDKFWHAHILDTAAYARDCENLFGRFMHHFPYFGIYGEDDKKDLDDSFAKTDALYQSEFGESMSEAGASNCSEDDPKCDTIGKCIPPENRQLLKAARCSGKACHAPTSCRCR